MRILLTKDGPRNHQQFLFDSAGHEFGAGSPGRLGEQIKRAARLGEFKAITEPGNYHVAFVRIVGAITAMSISMAASPAHWAGCGAHTNENCCNFIMV